MKLSIALQEPVKLDIVDSTNDYITNLLPEMNLGEGDVILADYQTHGKGQQENSWISEKGKNLTFSFILYPMNIDAPQQFYISMAVSIAICKYLLQHKINAKIKWPNDIYINKLKIGGILVENSLMQHAIIHSIIGIGLNINQIKFDPHIPNPTSLKKELFKDFNRDTIYYELAEILNFWLNRLYYSDFILLKDEYLNNLMNYNSIAKYKSDKSIFKGIIKDIEPTGELIIEILPEKQIKKFLFKEIEWIL